MELKSFVPKRISLNTIRLSLLAIVVGSLAAYGTMAFRLAFDAIPRWIYSGAAEAPHLGFTGIPGTQLILGLVGAGLLAGLAPIVFKFRRFQGVADVILSNHEDSAKMPVKEGVFTALFSAICIGVGAPVGRYGPAVHLGASLGSWLGGLLRLKRQGVQTLLGCGVAAGISASFDAPIAGVIFAHEVIIGHYSLRAFAPITIASVIGNLLPRLHEYEFTALQLSEATGSLYWLDYVSFGAIGVLGAAVAWAFMQGMLWSQAGIDRLRVPHWLQPALAGLIAGLVALKLPLVLGLGDEVILCSLSQTPEALTFQIDTMIALLLGKLIVTSLCLGWRMPGGVFAPSLFLGAMLGGTYALATGNVGDYQICVLVGIGAVVSSVVGAPIATILIVFELTRNYEAATAVMIGVVVSNVIITRFYSRSFFHRQIRLAGIDLNRGLESRIMEKREVSEVMRKKWVSVPPEASFGMIQERFRKDRDIDIYVVNSSGELVGAIHAPDLLTATAHSQTAEEISNIPDRILTADQSLSDGLTLIEKFVGISMPVVASGEDQSLVGVVTESDFIHAYNDAVRDAREEQQGI